VFSCSWVSLRCVIGSLTLFPTDRAFFPACLFVFSSACATVRLEVTEQREPGNRRVALSSLFLARSVWYFLYFLVFFPMVATSGGWCGTTLDLFSFCTQNTYVTVCRESSTRHQLCVPNSGIVVHFPCSLRTFRNPFTGCVHFGHLLQDSTGLPR